MYGSSDFSSNKFVDNMSLGGAITIAVSESGKKLMSY